MHQTAHVGLSPPPPHLTVRDVDWMENTDAKHLAK